MSEIKPHHSLIDDEFDAAKKIKALHAELLQRHQERSQAAHHYEAAAEPNDAPQQPVDLGQAIMHQIALRTGARIKMLEVEIVENVILIRGRVPCYYVKQLALQGVFDVVGRDRTSRVELNVSVTQPTMSVADN